MQPKAAYKEVEKVDFSYVENHIVEDYTSSSGNLIMIRTSHPLSCIEVEAWYKQKNPKYGCIAMQGQRWKDGFYCFRLRITEP